MYRYKKQTNRYSNLSDYHLVVSTSQNMSMNKTMSRKLLTYVWHPGKSLWMKKNHVVNLWHSFIYVVLKTTGFPELKYVSLLHVNHKQRFGVLKIWLSPKAKGRKLYFKDSIPTLQDHHRQSDSRYLISYLSDQGYVCYAMARISETH